MTTGSTKEREIDDYHAVAARKAGDPAWEPFRYERVDDSLLLTGGVPRLLKTGLRKGKKVWDRTAATKIVVTDAEADEHARARLDVGAGQS